MRNKRIFIILLILLFNFLPSCFGSNVQSQAPRSNGILNLYDQGPLTLDPALSSDLTSHTFIMQIFSGLIYLDDQLKPAPDIAEKWQRSQDGLTYTFTIRKGVRFQSGKEVIAQDFKYSWERACNPQTRSQVASTYLGDIAGVLDVLEGRATEISGIKVIDNYTLKVTIDSPKAYFLAKLAYSTAFVVDKNNVDSGRDWWRKPNGTGPFKLTEWKKDELITLKPNELYYREPARIAQINFHILAGVPVSLYELNKIDVTPISESNFEVATDPNGAFSKELVKFPELSFYFIAFNNRKPPFDDVNIRQAFCLAINKERIIKLTRKGMSTKANGIIPPGMPGYNPKLQGLDYDVAKAKELIAKSKYGNAKLPPITITDAGQGGNIPEYIGALIQDWQQNLGAQITVRQLEWEIFSLPQYLKQEANEMITYGWIADYADPQDFLDILFHSGADYNSGGYSNQQVDTLLNQAGAEADDAKRMALYQRAEQIIIDEAACLPLWFNTNYILIKPHVRDYRLDARGIPTLNQVSINK